MLKYLSANYILPITSMPLKDGIVAVDEEGVIQGIYDSTSFAPIDKAKVERYNGVIIPGFINAHCHIELSHMKGAIPRGTGLPNFLSQVMTTRGASMKKIDDAMAKADKEMYQNGIVAVGDHANTDNSSRVKQESDILYHTFIEVMGIEPAEADFKIKEAKSLIHEFIGDHVSITPHAPYSCSKVLFKKF